MSHRSHGSAEATVSGRPWADTLLGGRYEILEETDRPGGFAAYKARHVLLDSFLLLTALPGKIVSDPRRLAHVRAAVRAAGWLRHDHIVPVLDLVEDAGRYFIVEPFVDGIPLDRVIATRPLEAEDALHVARQLTDALAYAHAADVVHGSVSPASILVEERSPPRAWLSGFVLAALAEPGSRIGTSLLPYTAPERLMGQPADARADVYAVGHVLYELFEREPFFSGGRDEIEAILRDGTEPLLPRFSRVVPAGLAALVARTIRRSPAERQPQMAHVRGDLHACLRSIGQPPAEAPAPSEPPRPAAGRVARPARAPRFAAPARSRPAGTARPPLRRPAIATPVHPQPAGEPRARSLWPAREQREATFPSRILVRVEPPRRMPLVGKLMVAASLLALGWALLPLAASSLQMPVEPVRPPAPPPGDTSAEIAAAPEEPMVTPAPPRIEAREPSRDRVTLAAGQSTTFRVWPAPRTPGETLHYAWRLDGREVANEPEWRMTAPSRGEAATHLVEVEVSDAAGSSAPQVEWTVQVSAAKTASHRRSDPRARPIRSR